MRIGINQAVIENCEAIQELQSCVTELKAKNDPVITVDRKIQRCVWEYDLSFDGNIIATRGEGAPVPVASGVVGSPYTVSFPSPLVNPSIHVEVSADIGTGDSQGIINNAFIEQGVRFISPTVATFGLFSGDDGGGVDDLSRRAVTVFVHHDRECVCEVYIDGVAAGLNSAGGENGGEEDPTAPTLPLNDGKLVTDDFRDIEFNPYNHQIRNTSSGQVNWEARSLNRPYSDVELQAALNPYPDSRYVLTSIQNPDGTWNHLFSGTSPLGPFANIVIQGDPIPNFGNGANPTLYCSSN